MWSVECGVFLNVFAHSPEGGAAQQHDVCFQDGV